MLRTDSRFIALLVTSTIALGAGCMTEDGGPADDSSAAAPSSEAQQELAAPAIAVGERKAMPVRPADRAGVATDGTLPPKPASVAGHITPAVSWTVHLNASTGSLWPSQYTTLTATANMDVGPTPYYIRIWDGQAGVFLASCATGTTCVGTVTRPIVDYTSFTALVEDSAGYLQSTSLEYDIEWHGSGVQLTDPATTVAIGGNSTLTTTTTYDIGSSPFYVEIFDVTTATVLQICGAGTTCTATVSQAAAATHEYKAVFSGYGTSYPPPNVLETTASHYVTWASAGDSISLSAPATTFSTVTVTATSSIDVGPTPYYIQIYDEAGTRIASCGAGTTCSTSFTPATSGSHLVAFIAPSSTALPPAGAQAASHIVTTTRLVEPH